MLRLAGFFLVVFAATFVLRELPVVGAIFRIPFLGFWVAAILVSAVAARLGAVAVDRGRFRTMARQLGAVDTPHNAGKLGTLLLAQGNARKALPHLSKAAEGEPDSAEWHYRLGLAHRRTGDLDGAAAALERAAELNEEHAYGQVLLALAEVRARQGDGEASLAAALRAERNHGPKPESAYHRAVALRLLGRKDEAVNAFDEVGELAREGADYQRKGSARWVAAALWRRWF